MQPSHSDLSAAPVLLRPHGLLLALLGGSASEETLASADSPGVLGAQFLWCSHHSREAGVPRTSRVPVIMIDASEEVLPCLGDWPEAESMVFADSRGSLGMTPLLLEKHLLVTQAAVAGSRRQTFEVPVDGEDAGAVEVLRPARVRAFVLGGVPAPV